jgi:hypothetical protein
LPFAKAVESKSEFPQFFAMHGRRFQMITGEQLLMHAARFGGCVATISGIRLNASLPTFIVKNDE